MSWFEARGVTMRFDVNGTDVTALDGVSFSAERGEFIAIVGRSGCGKTTLLRVASGLLTPSAGEIFIDGKPADAESFKQVGNVFQEPRLMPWLTVEKNVLFGFLLDRNSPRERAGELLRMLGLTEFAGAWPSQLSGGMAQRVALGRALCYEPSMIMMDEPLGALDYFTRRDLQQEIIRIHFDTNTTILFVTHDIEEAILIAGRILVMKKGAIVGDVPVSLPYPRRASMEGFGAIWDEVLSLV